MWIWKWGCELLISNCSFNACITKNQFNSFSNQKFHFPPLSSLLNSDFRFHFHSHFCENQIWFEQLKIKNSSSSNCYEKDSVCVFILLSTWLNEKRELKFKLFVYQITILFTHSWYCEIETFIFVLYFFSSFLSHSLNDDKQFSPLIFTFEKVSETQLKLTWVEHKMWVLLKKWKRRKKEKKFSCRWWERMCGWELTTGSIIKLHEESCIKSWVGK